jgi:membrane associated rhomboid family serine protease
MSRFAASGAARPREPMFFIPGVVVVMVAALLAIHAGLTYFGESAQDTAYRELAFMPGRLTISLWPDRLGELLARVNDSRAAFEQAMLVRHFGILNGGAKIWTLATYALLHGSWAHVAVNCIWLVAFGPPIARRFGAIRFVLFFEATAIAGALAHWAYTPMDFSPLIGASAADSGLMAAAARFMFEPGAPLGGPRGYDTGVSSARDDGPAASLLQVFAHRRTLIFIGIWMATNFVFGAGAQTLGASEAPVAWVAHVGGFVAGLLLFPLFDRNWRRRRARD